VTPTRLRQIADRLQRVCSNYQELLGSGYLACKGCKQAADELRVLASKENVLAASVSTGSDTKCAVEIGLHGSIRGPRDAA
jgi:hypothetical protein